MGFTPDPPIRSKGLRISHIKDIPEFTVPVAALSEEERG